MNNIELKTKVRSVANELLLEKNYIAPIELMIKIGVLSPKDYESWRLGQIPYLETKCQINLKKLSLMMKELRDFANEKQLKASWTAYNQWKVKGKKRPLHFSKYGKPQIEKAYATHFVCVKNGDQ